MSTPPPRWRPSRAGILNVYQYEDETLHFAGGRLLLRGVNGSGKSTAMNMLLPFLLEADTRRIDAAGEQTGVLKSWMLADNDETQRTGYLWIEFARPDDDQPGGVLHHTVGCGIRANRSTDRVTPWWFSTPRRARIDFPLTANRVPLSVDGLRAELGTEAVFTTPTEYRAEISRRFFGGADPAAYLTLLHQVRNPRVGDRIDADLPRRLQEALPPVPEDAVADAAQPLEDLEDHRRNVVALRQTDRSLGSLLDTYRQYARRVVRGAAAQAAEAVTAARSASQKRGRLRTAADEAAAGQQRLVDEVEQLDRAHGEASARLSGLLTSDAYRDLQALIARRDHVASLETIARTLQGQESTLQRRLIGAVRAVAAGRLRIDQDLTAIGEGLVAAGRHARAAAAHLPLPDPPVLRVRPLAGDVDGPTPDADPLAGLDLRAAQDAVRLRKSEIEQVSTLLRDSERAGEVARRAAAEADRAVELAEQERERASDVRAQADAAGQHHRAAVLAWADQLRAHVLATPPAEPGGSPGWIPPPAPPDPGGDELRAVAGARVAAAADAARSVEATLEPAVTRAALRAGQAGQTVTRLSDELAAVQRAGELPLPRGGWQSPEPPDAALFASLVDFAPGSGDAERAGLEAACEAAGLLTARVSADGTAVAANGELLVTPGRPASPNLASVLTPAVPAGVAVDEPTIRRLLEHVGVGAASAAALWVAPDGRFGAGPLRGRHAKAAAEHIGAGARAMARQRRIAELSAALADAEQVRDRDRGVHTALLEHRREVHALGARIPSTRAVDDAAATAVGAVRDAQRAVDRADHLRAAAVETARGAERAWAAAETGAASTRLPLDAAELTAAAAAIGDAAGELRLLPGRIGSARRSFDDWTSAVGRWEEESAALTVAAEEAVAAADQARQTRIELTSAEAALGDEPVRVAAQVEQLTLRRDGLVADVRARRAQHSTAVATAARFRSEAEAAEDSAERAEQVCLAERRALLAATAVDGLLAAAGPERAPTEEARAEEARAGETGPGEAGPEEPSGWLTGGSRPATPDTIDGTARLVAALREAVPAPDREVGEDALDRSLRAVRDGLGSGWDAEARRGTDGAPVAVEVSGPYGRRALLDATVQVEADLRRARGLLTAQQDQALRNLLHGRVAREVARALFEAHELIDRMNAILGRITTGQGIGVRLDWRTRGDLDPATATALRLLAKDPDARTAPEDAAVRTAVAGLVDEARSADPEASYRDVIGDVLDYRRWHDLKIYLRRPGRPDELLTRRTRLSEGEKKLVTYLPMAAAASAAAAACDPHGAGAPRLILLDDAFAKVSEDNHAQLFGLLVSLDLDFVITSERLFGTHASVPELAITEVLRDADLRTIALVHYHWDGHRRTELAGGPA